MRSGMLLGFYTQGNARTIDRSNFNVRSNSTAMAAPASLPFPRNIIWSHSRINIKRLQHWPDVFIRPGGLCLRECSEPQPLVTPTDMDVPATELKPTFDPVRGGVPLGGPVRVEFAVVRDSDDPEPTSLIPEDIGLKSPFVYAYP